MSRFLPIAACLWAGCAPLSFENFEERYQKAFCDSVETCADFANYASQCPDLVGIVDTDDEENAPQGCEGFDADIAQECLDALKDSACASSLDAYVFPEACEAPVCQPL